MPNEIQYAHLDPGLSTLTARLRTGTTDVVSGIALSDTSKPRWYVGSIPGGTADGDYEVVIYEGSELVGVGDRPLRWRSNAEALSPLLTEIPPAVRTNLATELGRMDVAVSTRAAPGAAMALTSGERTTLAAQIEAALLADGDGQAFVNAIVAAIGNVNVNQAVFVAAIRADLERAGGLLDVLPTLTEIEASAILAKQATLVTMQTAATALSQHNTQVAEHDATQAAVAALPAAATVAAAVRTNLATELARVDVAVSTREAESAAAARAVTNQTEHDATQVGIAAIAAIGDPLTKPVPGTYPAGSAGEALGKLVIGPPDEPAVVIPGPPADTGLCRVYAYLEGINNDKRLPTARIEFRLIAPDGTKAVASERLIGERAITIKVDGLGRLQGEDGQPWIDLQRNDMLTPAGTTYEVTSAALGISRKSITLTTTIADLRTLLLA